MKAKTKISRKSVVKKLDDVFSKFVRLEASFMGDAVCVTCGIELPWQKLQAGHYESRGSFNTRWDEENVHVQCVGCNVFKKGNYPAYARYMIRKYGAEKLEELAVKSKQSFNKTTPELLAMIAEYEARVAELMKKN